MNDERLVAASDECFYESWRTMADAAGGVVHETDGILIAAPGAGPTWVNLIFVTQPLSDPERQLTEAFTRLDDRSIPFLVRIRDGLDPASERAAEQLGLQYTDSIPGMALAPIPSDGRPQDAPKLLPPGLRRAKGTFWYLGYLDGEAVAASELELLKDAAGINFIGTLEEHRGHGFGEAMTWRVVDKGSEEGREIAVLQASESGQPVYERMGFRTVAAYKTFVRPEWID
jgi:GNAT superfamily N-acetyltransferase